MMHLASDARTAKIVLTVVVGEDELAQIARAGYIEAVSLSAYIVVVSSNSYLVRECVSTNARFAP
jgi:hypothetical protein